MSPLQIRSELFVFDTPPLHGLPGLKMTAKRYYTPFSDPQGLTLLFAHGVGAHKEHWEPMLRYLFSHQNLQQPSCIREAWCFDWLNHGDAAVINKAALERRPPGDVSIAEWAAAIASFVKSPFLRGHRLVGLGHSAGSSAIILSTRAFPMRNQPFVAVFLLEPSMLTRKLWMSHQMERETLMRKSISATLRRRSVFDTWEEAVSYYRNRKPWAGYDHEVFNVFTQYGFHSVGVQDGSKEETKVTLKCDLQHEALAYQDVESHFEATDQYTRLCRVVPVHIVFGTIHDYIPSYFQDCMTDISQGRSPASVKRVPGAGHGILQQAPEGLAKAVFIGLNSITRDSTSHLLHRL
ncbi:Alpha/beta hydrolase fold-1 [Suillus subaureus]|uniref:Alpha/beta hydrolase fold-1 n=1 Tax=Suillus subaureus TaxID=48587 RepID=A0A9P7EE29_9AGAM|nr:Alpha/beta hydrolase fold-1 [Suillus subaureus]KAG1818470.1 Alpha/beta hydrolase fold-1 [Suillus subaureus]